MVQILDIIYNIQIFFSLFRNYPWEGDSPQVSRN